MNIEDILIEFIINELHSGDKDLEVSIGDDLLGTGLVESMGMMRIIQYLEEKYDIKVEPEDMTIDNFISVSAMSHFTKEKLFISKK